MRWAKNVLRMCFVYRCVSHMAAQTQTCSTSFHGSKHFLAFHQVARWNLPTGLEQSCLGATSLPPRGAPPEMLQKNNECNTHACWSLARSRGPRLCTSSSPPVRAPPEAAEVPPLIHPLSSNTSTRSSSESPSSSGPSNCAKGE